MRCRSRALKQQLHGEKLDVEVGHLSAFGWAMLFSCPVLGWLLAWQWHVIGVMYWILHDVKLKWYRRVTERKVRGGGRRERELSFGIQINELNKTKQKKKDLTLEKEEGLQFQTFQEMNGKTRVPRKKPQWSDAERTLLILIFMKVPLLSKFRETSQSKRHEGKKKRELHVHIRTHMHPHAFTHFHSSIVGYSEGTGRAGGVGGGGGKTPKYWAAYWQPRKA